MKRLLAPPHRGATLVAGLILAFLALTLLVIGANSPYTHSNLAAGYDTAYTRTEQIVVGAAPGGRVMPPQANVPAGDARGEHLYVTAGCAGCHGLSGEGGPLGKTIAGAAPDLIATKVRAGATRMPPFATEALSDQELAEITAYLRRLGAPQTSTAPPAPPAATADRPPAPSASPSAGASAGDPTIALGKRVFETAGGKGCTECHGPDGKGQRATDGTTAPNIRGATERKLREALAGGAALMTYIKLSDQEIEAVIKYLEYLDQQ